MAKNVLLVDDSQAVRSLIKIYLILHDLSFVEADDGARALELIKLLPIDLIIADINMPGVDGITFVRRLRATEDPQLAKLPVILLTGDKSDQLREEGLKAGADHFLRKPVTSSELLEVVRKCFPEPR